ncbi:hypothetical protein EF989_25155 [Salmonella enterica]|uniref:Uncharacterized protein n=10 Tax=Salmonella enterica TaxID=28901 RepID=A0A3Y8WK70_SALET|nr:MULTISPECIES: hypothetical protein [Salmonella]EAB8044624.1 hypothetical protein [Salmonella enterica subsp. enterica serovar Tees]EAN4869932.1 hypothetical protein [Salmonella enterica subsp. enterica serovar Bergen]EAO4363038.1 hypothetical protein [Salmonella enterica subsp. enterica serovar Bere]EBG5867593.1 hypothetical protein [Salmonella enterica subsp. enterica serovar Essen]EBH9668572.1 hypothetical protein [Salmonella enterica subsp. enterica serovar 4,[5],12:i:-]EBS0485885.1 hyp
MEEVNAEFTIVVESDLDKYELIDFLSQGIPDIIKVNSLYLRYENTMITIERNYDWNPKLINVNDGWLYYKYELTVFFMENTSYEYQYELANKIMNALREAGYLAESIW